MFVEAIHNSGEFQYTFRCKKQASKNNHMPHEVKVIFRDVTQMMFWINLYSKLTIPATKALHLKLLDHL